MHLFSKDLGVPDTIRSFRAFVLFCFIREAIEMKNVGGKGEIFLIKNLTTLHR